MMETIREVWKMRRNRKGAFFLLAFRTSAFFTRTPLLRLIGWPIRNLYNFIVIWLLGIEVPDRTRIGKGFTLFHGQGLVVNENTVIGDHVVLRHTTTIGNARDDGLCPVIGDYVEVGAHCVIIGDIRVGDHSVVAAGAVVITDVPPYSIVAGNPAHVVKTLLKPL